MNVDDIIRLFTCISLVIGAIECFAGFKIMKAMMAIWGLFIGAMLGVVLGVNAKSILLGIVFVLLLGIGLAVLSYKLHLAGIFILTTFLTAVALYVIFENIVVAILIGLIVGGLAIYFVKPTVIITTSFSGAGIILFSAYKMMNLELNTNVIATVMLWIPITLAGIACQYITTQNARAKKSRKRVSSTSHNPSMTFSERKYPGMQRAYRNFCIKCGCELQGVTEECPRCGYSFDD